MIDRQEVMDFAREFGLSVQVIEKDYALGWLLAGIAAHPEIGRSWVFKRNIQRGGMDMTDAH